MEEKKTYTPEKVNEKIAEHIDEKRKISTDQELIYRKQQIEIEQIQQRFQSKLEEYRLDRELKKEVFKNIFALLKIESIAVLFVLIIQGMKLFGFHLEANTLNIFISATIIQISSMAYLITKYLFSEKSSKQK